MWFPKGITLLWTYAHDGIGLTTPFNCFVRLSVCPSVCPYIHHLYYDLCYIYFRVCLHHLYYDLCYKYILNCTISVIIVQFPTYSCDILYMLIFLQNAIIVTFWHLGEILWMFFQEHLLWTITNVNIENGLLRQMFQTQTHLWVCLI